MPNVYFLAALVWLLSLVGVGWKLHSMGVAETKSAYVTRDLQDERMYSAQFRGINARYRDIELKWADRLSTVSTKYEQEVAKNAKTKADLDAARKRGAVVLRDPGRTGGEACGGGTPETAPGTGQRDGPPGARLSESLADFLVAEASRADAIVLQLTACQDVLDNERK